jgi:hypothetical protein
MTDAELTRMEIEADDDRVRRLAREVRRVRQALHRYAIHDEDCALEEPHDEERPPDCTCGLDAVAGGG